jgi:predicted metal-binding membrane protein
MNFTTESPTRNDRPITLVLAWLSLLAGLCWATLVLGGLQDIVDAITPAVSPELLTQQPQPPRPYTAAHLALAFAIWSVLCIALMLPLATPAAVLYARVAAQRGSRWPRLRTVLFVLGYLGPWTVFAAGAALAQWTLHVAGLLDPGMAVRHPAAAGLALVAAGVYQWLPVTHDCLDQCRAPLANILAGWRGNASSALAQGVHHARSCLGCCWLLMLLPLAAGPGNPLAIAVVGMLVLFQIRLESGHWIASLGGLALLAWGTRLLFP